MLHCLNFSVRLFIILRHGDRFNWMITCFVRGGSKMHFEVKLRGWMTISWYRSICVVTTVMSFKSHSSSMFRQMNCIAIWIITYIRCHLVELLLGWRKPSLRRIRWFDETIDVACSWIPRLLVHLAGTNTDLPEILQVNTHYLYSTRWQCHFIPNHQLLVHVRPYPFSINPLC